MENDKSAAEKAHSVLDSGASAYWKRCIELVEQSKEETVDDKGNHLLSLAHRLASSYTTFSTLDPRDVVEFYHNSWTEERDQEYDSNDGQVYVVYDGSFAPVHNGHVSAAVSALCHIKNYYRDRN